MHATACPQEHHLLVSRNLLPVQLFAHNLLLLQQDECQDVAHSQYRLLRALPCSKQHHHSVSHNVCSLQPDEVFFVQLDEIQ